MAAEVYEFGPFRFESRRRELLRDGHPIELTPRSALLLLVLLEGGGEVVTRDELDRRVWGDAHVGLGSLPFQVHQLRRSLGEMPDGQRVVETAPRQGYRIALPIRRADTQAPTSDAQILRGSPTPPVALFPAQPPGRLAWFNWGLVAVAVMAIGSAAMAAIWRPRSVPRVTGVTAITRDGTFKGGPLLIQDGSVLYRTSSGLQLERVTLRGGGTGSLLRSESSQRVLDFSSGRAEYLLADVPETTRFDLWIAPASGGVPRRVGDRKCDQASWSPTGERVACTIGDTLSVFDSDGTDIHTVARPAGERPTWPRWSPDGERIAFTVERRRNRVVTSSLWEVRPNGTGARELVPGWPESRSRCCASWSPDGRYLAFVSEEANQYDLWLVGAGSTGSTATAATPTRLTNGPLQLTSPLWAPDGRRLVALGVARGGEMVRYDARLREFVPYLGGLSATWLSFSRDGRWMAYSSFPDNALWRARADGSDRQPLTAPMGVQESSWSPDGARIAFRTEAGSETPRLYIVARDGGPLQALPLPSPSVGMPTWSPDGRQLLTSDVPGTFAVPDGTERVRLYDVATSRWSVVPGSEGLWRARWSPDGRYIAALTIRGGQQLRLYDTGSRTWSGLAADHINGPNWSRDGRYIYYDTEGSAYSLRRVGIPHGSVEELTSLSTFSRAAYWWSGVSPEGDPILLRNIGALELYTLDIDGL